jgi:hypothetical protein
MNKDGNEPIFNTREGHDHSNSEFNTGRHKMKNSRPHLQNMKILTTNLVHSDE